MDVVRMNDFADGIVKVVDHYPNHDSVKRLDPDEGGMMVPDS